MAKSTAEKTNEQQERAAMIEELRQAAQAGDPEAAMELQKINSKTQRNSEYKYDARTEVASGPDGDQYGVVTWNPNDSDEKFHYVIHILADGKAEIIHGKSGKPYTLDKPSSMKAFISAYRSIGKIID